MNKKQQELLTKKWEAERMSMPDYVAMSDEERDTWHELQVDCYEDFSFELEAEIFHHLDEKGILTDDEDEDTPAQAFLRKAIEAMGQDEMCAVLYILESSSNTSEEGEEE